MIECTHHDCRCARAAELAAQGRTADAVLVHQQPVRCRRPVDPTDPSHPEPKENPPMPPSHALLDAATHTRTLRGLGEADEEGAPTPPPEDRTSTLRGLGFTSATLRGLGQPAMTPAPSDCPCCRVKADQVSTDLAACLGVALVFVKGADAAKSILCVMHARLLKLLVDELRVGPKRVGDGTTWDD